MKRGIAAVVALGLVVSACDDGSPSPLDGDSPARVDDVLDAAGASAGDMISASGYLLLQLEGRPALLCDHPLDSRPPQCGAPGLPVEGIDVADMPDATTAGAVSWVEDVTLEGRLVADRVDVARELTAIVDGQAEVAVHLRQEDAE